MQARAYNSPGFFCASKRVGSYVTINEAQPKHKEPVSLLPPEIREQLPTLYANEELGLMAQALVKFFTPDSNWTWYASEFDGEDTFFGLVIGFMAEFGYFTLSELEEARGPLGLPIERDEHFEPKSLRELRDHYKEKGWAL